MVENWQLINTAGLALDMVGAWLVANEVTSKFGGEKYIIMPIQSGGTTGPYPTDDFSDWEGKHFLRLRVGIGCLMFGFLMQIISTWLQ